MTEEKPAVLWGPEWLPRAGRGPLKSSREQDWPGWEGMKGEMAESWLPGGAVPGGAGAPGSLWNDQRPELPPPASHTGCPYSIPASQLLLSPLNSPPLCLSCLWGPSALPPSLGSSQVFSLPPLHCHSLPGMARGDFLKLPGDHITCHSLAPAGTAAWE